MFETFEEYEQYLKDNPINLDLDCDEVVFKYRGNKDVPNSEDMLTISTDNKWTEEVLKAIKFTPLISTW